MPFVLEVYPAKGTLLGLGVEDAVHCGVCKPRPEPVQMEFLADVPVTENTGKK
jgi:hypothetical protein